jgi:hypothetical protein
MARWSSAASAALLGATLLYSVMALTTALAQQPGNNMQVINMDGRRNSKFTCADTKKDSKRPGCRATCPTRCPKKCLVLCPTCKTFCCK